MTRHETKDRILTIAHALLAEQGVGGVTFDAIAARLGRTKQAVLYWFPNKPALLAALFVPWLEAEAQAAIRALDGVTGRAPAIATFVRAVAAFHLDDLNRFRLMYLAPQMTPPREAAANAPDVAAKVVPVTDRFYAALARHLDGTEEAARREAVAIHAAILGLVLMVALSDAIKDPLKHDTDALVDLLVENLTPP